MSLLDHAEAMALLEDSILSAQAVAGCRDHLQEFAERYLPRFYREEQRGLAKVVLEGKLSHLQRKTSEPIARQAGIKRRNVQQFVGAGAWDDTAVREELWHHVAEEIGDPDAVLIVDPSSFPKKGTESCGVDRQWCGCLGKVENAQVGVFVSYAAAAGHTLVDGRLYLPREWAKDAKRRKKCHVPKEVVFQEKWRIGLELLDRVRGHLPHGWVTGDDELGRATEFRAQLRLRHERYVLDVPCNTLVREVLAGERLGPFERVEVWAKKQPKKAWKTLTIRDGEKEPVRVRALKRRLQLKDDEGRVGPRETVLVIRTLGQDQRTYYAVSNALRKEELHVVVKPKLQRHRIEEDLQAGKQEVGMDHYEVRSWPGWEHHMTLTFLALWFLALETNRLGKKLPP